MLITYQQKVYALVNGKIIPFCLVAMLTFALQYERQTT